MKGRALWRVSALRRYKTLLRDTRVPGTLTGLDPERDSGGSRTGSLCYQWQTRGPVSRRGGCTMSFTPATEHVVSIFL
jgi:hypothetical protein